MMAGNSNNFRQKQPRFAIPVAILLIACWGTRSQAELQQVLEERNDAGIRTIYKMSVTPAAAPVPALRHQLVVRPIDHQPGNAAIHYLRAYPEGGIEARIRQVTEEYGDGFQSWYDLREVPLKQLPLGDAKKVMAAFDGTIRNFIAPATECRECDWGLGIEEMRGPDIIMMVLPEFNASRMISRLLALRTRVAIADGDYPKALQELRMNYRLAQNVGREPLLVCGLIGIAEANIANEQVIEFIAAKDSPNLYWALAELPNPLVDIRRDIQFETSLGLRMFPFLMNAEKATHSAEEWARLFSEALSELEYMMPGPTPALLGSGTLRRASPEVRQAIVAGAFVALYPAAKQRLLDAGWDVAQINAMPVGKVIAMDAEREYRRQSDEYEKWTHIPYHISRTHPARQQAEQRLREESPMKRGLGGWFASLLIPAVNAATAAEARLAWHLGALQVIEAIRMHAADTGTLPASLQDITVVPLPLNPATNQPYQYTRQGETAVLDLPFSDGFAGGIARRFEITLEAP